MHTIPAFIAVSLLLAPLSTSAAGGNLTVTTSLPALSGTIAQGAQRIPMLTLTLQASCQGNVTVTSLRLRHSGMAPAADLLRIYAVEGFARASRMAAVSAQYPSTIRLTSYTVPACSTKTLTIVADLSSQAAPTGWHTISLLGVSANAPVTVMH